MTAPDTAAIRAQMQALVGHTEGPWHVRTLENFGWNIVQYRGGDRHDIVRVAKIGLRPDARLIAAAPDMRSTVLALCGEVDRLRAENERLGRDLNMAKYGKPDFAWSTHLEVMADLRAENERLRGVLEGMDLEAQRETVEALHKPTLIHLVMKMSDDARAALTQKGGEA